MRVRKLLNFKLNLITDGHYILKVIMFNFIYIYIYIYICMYIPSLIKGKRIGVEIRMRIAADHCFRHVFKSRNDSRMSYMPVLKERNCPCLYNVIQTP